MLDGVGVFATIGTLCLASAAWPLMRGLRAARGTPLWPTVLWLSAAWLAGLAVGPGLLLGYACRPWLYIALALAACAGVSVLGARRPGLGPWNFVTLGLLAVLLMPLLEQRWNAEHWSLDTPRTAFLAVVLLVGVVNFLPTRWGLWAGVAGACFTLGVIVLARTDVAPETAARLVAAALGGLGLACWGAWLVLRRRSNAGPVDRIWLAFRDRFGLVWAKRVQEQFNQAALHAEHAARLRWPGLVGEEKQQEQLRELLLAVLKRFGVQDEAST
jgi:hypothetical protein